MFLFGISAGIPLLLIFSSLGLWLREAGVDRSTATFFSWAALGYSFKFVWAPIIDRLPLPWLSKRLGRRRAWLLLAQAAVILAIALMAVIDPAASEHNLKLMALACVMLGFSSATQDIVIDAYRIESAGAELQAMMSSTYIAGYRIGMLISGAGALLLSGALGTELGDYRYTAWKITYLGMALTMLIGVLTTLSIPEPDIGQASRYRHGNQVYIRFFTLFLLAVGGFILTFYFSSTLAADWKAALAGFSGNSALSAFCVELLRLGAATCAALSVAAGLIRLDFVERSIVMESYVSPVVDFFRRYALKTGLLLLLLICLYRISDIVLGVITNIFFQDLGYSKQEIGSVVKTFGLFVTIAGGFLGGILAVRFGIIKILFLGALLTALTNLLFMLLALAGYNMPLLYVVISADNLSAGIASAAFVAFLSRLTNVSFTAMQYAIFSSLMTLIPKIIGGYSGSIVEQIGYSHFFLFASLLGAPVLGIIYLAARHLRFDP